MYKKLLLIPITMILASCLSSQSQNDNPFFAEWDTPHGVPPFDRIRPEHFMSAFLEGIRRGNADIEAIVNDPAEPAFENVILAYDNAGEFLSRVNTVFGGINSANTSAELQDINRELTPILSKYNNDISLNPQLFARVRAIYDKRNALNLDAEQMRLVENIYRGFERSGANLSDEEKVELREINEKLSMLSLQFGNNLLADNKEFAMVIDSESDLSGLPESVKAAAASEAAGRGMAGKWVFTLDKPSWIPFLQYSDRPDLRKKLYAGYINLGNNNNANNNLQLINEIIDCRTRKANLLGFDSHASFTLDRVMAGNPDNVYELLYQIWYPALDRAKAELAEMKAIKAAEGAGSDFDSSDWWYYAEKVRKAKYDLDESELRPYFQLDGVRDGIFMLVNKLYGLRFVPLDAPKYHEDCQVFEVFDRDGSLLGIQYLDFFPRSGKRSGAWCGSYRPVSYDDRGNRIPPVSTIVCNFTPPAGDAPALLSLDETETFFHEFGHALHGLMSEVKYRGIRGTERDFVELPSQIMENWAFEPEFLKMYAKHYLTGAVIPDDLIGKINESSLFNQGFMTVELTAASITDMDIHTITDYGPFDVTKFEAGALARIGNIAEIEPRYHYPYFQHIFSGGYSSGYYSYLWAEVLDADAYQAFAETGDIFNPAVARAFRENILSKGGSDEGMAMYRNFRGRLPDRDSFLRRRGLTK